MKLFPFRIKIHLEFTAVLLNNTLNALYSNSMKLLVRFPSNKISLSILCRLCITGIDH